MAIVEVEIPDGALRFLRAMQILWQYPNGWVEQYLSNAILKAIEKDIDEGIIDRERVKEACGINRLYSQELPLNKEAIPATA